MNALSPIPTYVYCIRCDETQTVKIGVSDRPKRRLAQLQTGAAHWLRIVAIIPAYPAFEAAMHKMFHGRRLAGEWFTDDDRHVSDAMIGAARFLGRCGVTIEALEEMAGQPVSANARLEHADALEAEGQIANVA